MTNDVQVTVRGVQMVPGAVSDEPIVLQTTGKYKSVAGRHHVVYHEVLEGTTGDTRNHVVLTRDGVEVRKDGEVSVDMVFELGKKNVTYYKTKYGTLVMSLYTTDLSVVEEEERIAAQIRYSISANHQHIADCTMEMEIKNCVPEPAV